MRVANHVYNAVRFWLFNDALIFDTLLDSCHMQALRKSALQKKKTFLGLHVNVIMMFQSLNALIQELISTQTDVHIGSHTQQTVTERQ